MYNKLCYVINELSRAKLSVPSYSLQGKVFLAFQLAQSYIQCIDFSCPALYHYSNTANYDRHATYY